MNNPVIYRDPPGHWAIFAVPVVLDIAGAFFGGATIDVGFQAAEQLFSGVGFSDIQIDTNRMLGSAAFGGVTGGIGKGIGMGWSAATKGGGTLSELDNR